MEQSIVWTEVDSEDSTLVRSRFPGAAILSHAPSEHELIETYANATVVCCFIHTHFPRSVIEKLPALQLLVTRSVGFDHIDLPACKERGITVCNVPDYGSHVIAEHVFALLLSTLRHIPEAHRRMEGGTFDYHGLRGMAMKGKTIGIVGTGKIGRQVACIAHGFGMRILLTDQCRVLELTELYGARYVLLPEILANSDIITLHIPGTKDTEHIINAAAFAAMKDGVVVVNTARGSLIDSVALLTALKTGKVAYALLDVLEHETNFSQNTALVAHPRVISTPHIAFYADDSMRNMYLDAFQSIEQWQHDEKPDHEVQPLNIVCDLPAIKASAAK